MYGQLYQTGVTEPAGASASVTAQFGYGPRNANPENQAGWVYLAATFDSQVGNNDQYRANATAPAVAGSYSYTYRFSLDSGVTWTYCDANGAGSIPSLWFEVTQLPLMTVSP